MSPDYATFFDAHTHIHFPAYDQDREEVFARAKLASVKMITVGTQESTSRGAVEFAKAHLGDVWATVGFHPAHFSFNWHHDKGEQSHPAAEQLDIEKLKNLAQESEVVAIGECGLDYFRVNDDESKKRQREGFVKQLELAAAVKKPLMVHCRAAFDDLIATLKSEVRCLKSETPAVIHFFTGSIDDAKKLLDLGFAFTFGGVITFARDYDEVIKMIPLDRILSETDAPYVAPAPYRGKRNEPAYVVEVIKKLAEIKNVSLETMTEQVWTNAQMIFKI